MKKRNLLRIIGFLLFAGIVIFSALKLYGVYSEYAAGSKLYEDMADKYVSAASEEPSKKADGTDGTGSSEQTEPQEVVDIKPPSVDFAALKETCPDVVAWIFCGGTPVNYPVVQSSDNVYYLYRLLDGRQNKNGTLFMDCRNSSDFSDWNSVIYGHNMKNNSMFGIVPEYMDQEFYEKHPVWYLLTEEQDYRIELVGGYVTPADSDIYALPATQEKKSELLKRAARKSSFESDTKVNEDDRMITLSTCVYDYENARYVLVGVLRPYDDAEVQ